MNADEMLTIVLVIKDRVPFTFRWMAYADKISFPFKVLIADGGKDEQVTAKLTNQANFPNVNYEYIRYPYDQGYPELYAKMADALSRVDTPFVTMVDNACFYVVDGLRRCVEFLHAHPDYSGCGGDIGSFSMAPFYTNEEIICVFGKEVRFFSNRYHFQQLIDETAEARVWKHFLHYAPTYFDVHRVEQLALFFKVLKNLDLNDIFLAELLTSFLTVCAGKVRKESYLYMLRQVGHRSSCAKAHTEKWGDEFDRMLLESWSNDFAKFVNAVASAISQQDGIPLYDAQQQVKKGYRVHIAPYIVEVLSKRNGRKGSAVINLMRNLAQNLEYDSLTKRVLYKLYSSISGMVNNRAQKNQPVPIYKSSEFYKDIKPIQNFLTNPHLLKAEIECQS